jgi:hypothetical protein
MGWFRTAVELEDSMIPDPSQPAAADLGMRAEVRVHGVSATPPATMLASPQLQTPTPVRVAGDNLSGFYHREYQADVPWDRVEAYSWGGLTSGKAFRALWVLLTPFLLVNVAYWASPVPLGERPSERQADDPGNRWFVRGASGVIQRLFALSLTATFVLGIVIAAMDVVGFQYVRVFFASGAASLPNQPGRTAWFSFLDWSWLAHPNLEFLVTALAPLAGVLVLWYLGYKSWRRLESVNGPSAAAEDPAPVTPLEDRRLWNGLGPVARLRAVHVTFGLAIVAASMLSPLLLSGELGQAQVDLTVTWWGVAALVDAGAIGILLALSIALVVLPSMSHRPRLTVDATPPPTPWLYRFLPWASLVVTGAAGAILLASGSSFPSAGASLPGVVEVIEGLFLVQAGLLVVLAVATLILRSAIPRDPAAEVPVVAGGTPANARPVWMGLTPVVLSTLGWLLAGSWSAALTLLAVKTTGGSVQTSAQGSPPIATQIVVPAPMIWAAGATLAVVLAGLLILVGLGIQAWIVKDLLGSDIAGTYAGQFEEPIDSTTNRTRFRSIRMNWLLGRAPDFIAGTFAVFVAALWVVIIAGIVLYWRDASAISPLRYAWLYQAGSVVTLGIGGLSVLIARFAFSDPNDRKKIGVLWDVGTFWPRATHPLAPPCYAERAVPDLLQRTQFYRGDAGPTGVVPSEGLPVVLSCHSQGSIIGAAVILQMTYHDLSNVSFLTYGSPLRRLYARYFPAYFGARTLSRIGTLLNADSIGSGMPITTTPADRATWRWRNLWRPTDPVGHPVFVDYTAYGAQDDVDVKLRDPLQFGPAPGDTTAPGANDHSNYPLDPAYAWALETVLTFDEAAVLGL